MAKIKTESGSFLGKKVTINNIGIIDWLGSQGNGNFEITNLPVRKCIELINFINPEITIKEMEDAINEDMNFVSTIVELVANGIKVKNS